VRTLQQNEAIVQGRARPVARERVHGTTYATRADAQADLFEYIEVFYNRSRRHSTLRYSSPIRFLEDWISKHAAQHSMAA
jgi:putative transposase